MDHLREQSVIDLIAGALVEPHAASVHEHLDRCGECRALVGLMARVEATPQRLGMPREPRPTLETVAEMPAARRGPPSPRWPVSSPSAAPPLPPPPLQPLPIEHLDEYRVLALLGRGGMGTVYRAHDTLLDREVAIKLMARTG